MTDFLTVNLIDDQEEQYLSKHSILAMRNYKNINEGCEIILVAPLNGEIQLQVKQTVEDILIQLSS